MSEEDERIAAMQPKFLFTREERNPVNTVTEPHKVASTLD